jgi:hypothetical protein
MKSILVTILSILVFSFACYSQTSSNKIRLIKWSTASCDNTFDPYLLKPRVSSIEYTDTTTIFTVHFSDNCCVAFKPAMNFYKNKLVLLPYREYKGDYCSCNCSFSIRYEIAGLVGKKYQLYFKESEVILTDNYYDTVKPSFQVYKGRNINRMNKYGFKEGTWIKFYENGNEEIVSEYPDQSLFYDLSPLWSKGYYSSGTPSFFERNDTSESWFEDGEIKSQFIKYEAGDTTFEKGFRKFDSRMLQKEYFEKFYPTIFKSEFDPDYKQEAAITETVYKKEYFKNGKPKFIFGSDTSFSWFETGQLESKKYKNGTMVFDENGVLTQRSFSWLEKGPKHWRNLDNTLNVQFYPNGNIKEIELVRDEPTEKGIAPGVRYSWIWDEEMNLDETPEKWKEPFPWAKFTDLQVTPKMQKGLEKNSIRKANSL